MAEQQSPISPNPKMAFGGLNLDSVASQVKQGEWSFCVNGLVEGFDGNQVSLQNEQANLLCTNFPEGYIVNGNHNIIEDGIKIFFLLNPITGDSEIGKIVDCLYSKIINDPCLGFDVNHPILKTAHRKTECDTEIFWVDGFNRNRYLNLNILPYKEIPGEDGCHPIITDEIDCNLMNIQPDFSIPQIIAIDVPSDGTLVAGTYQFAVQYADGRGEPATSYYSVTNPLPIFDPTKITMDFNYEVGKAIVLNITDIDNTGLYTHINLAVIKTINNIPTPELVGTFSITGPTLSITYTGQGKTDIQLSINDIFQKYDIYETANDLTVAQDILILADLTTQQRISYQEIASQIELLWQTWRVPADPGYSDPLIATYLKSGMRDEVYPWEIVFLLDNGYQTDGFHMPGRRPTETDLEPIAGNDVIPDGEGECDPAPVAKPRWQVYNTGCLYGFDQTYLDFTQGIVYPCPKCPPVIVTIPENAACYTGPYEYGCMAYWESTDLYPCNDIYGSLQNTPIRHSKFPDSLITHIHDDEGFIYPIGLRIDIQQISDLITESSLTDDQKARIQGFKIVRGNRANHKSVIAKGLINNVGKYTRDEQTYFYPNYPYNDLRADPYLSTIRTGDDSGRNESTRLQGFNTDDSKNRWTFHSPDTSFYQPTLGSILKLETAEYGNSKGHFQLVQKHSRYKFLSAGSYASGLVVAAAIGILSATIGVSTQVFDGTAAFTAFNTFLNIVENLIPRQNFAYQYNSIGEYEEYRTVLNNGFKQRRINLSFYLEPGMVNRGDTLTINNFQREGSVYLRTSVGLPFPSTLPGVPPDTSRWITSDYGCDNDQNAVRLNPISSYYSSIKRNIPNQYGQLYSYETIDTGYQFKIAINTVYAPTERTLYIFGGDTFINKFAYKSKLPFFIDNRAGTPDESDVEYDEIPNVAHPIFWLSTDSEADTTGGSGGLIDTFKQFFGVKLNNFDCPSPKFFYQKGKFYLFAYGIPYFYVESDVNVDLRQAFNDKEGDFFPRVSSDIPDQWLQEINTTINQDNTYYYNKTYSKQNKENFFAHLPNDWVQDDCVTNYPFKGIFSEDWHLFKPSSFFNFPQNFGSLTSLDGIENRQVLARFENKTLLYNALLTAPTSAADVYLGQSLFSSEVPPLDYGDTNLGYIGSQHKFILKTEYGHVTGDSRRGQVFLLMGQEKKEITNENVSKFFAEFFDFQIAREFPDVNIDNHYNGIGLTGVYDNRYKRLILTKLDYKPLINGITHTNGKFYYNEQEISLQNKEYFCSYSFTISYCFKYGVWASFHTYLPNYYIGSDNIFYSGINSTISSIWTHNESISKFNNFYDSIHPYTIEYPYSFSPQDQILQNIKDYSKIYQYTEYREFVETDEYYFNELVGYSNQQCTGILKLIKKPSHNLSTYSTYPIYNTDNKEITFTKSGSFYQINTFWDMVKSTKKPIWLKSCENLSIYKELNQDNLDYGKRSYLKSPLRSKELKLRFTLSDRDDLKIVSGFTLSPSQTSYK